MARITVEDCLDKVDNRFQLVMISSKRARQLQIEGKEPQVPVDKDKPTVVALREIAEGLIDVGILTEKPRLEMEDMELEAEALAEAVSEVKAAAEGEAAREAAAKGEAALEETDVGVEAAAEDEAASEVAPTETGDGKGPVEQEEDQAPKKD